MSGLDAIFRKHRADKGSQHHNYTALYELLLDYRRLDQLNVIEFGVLRGSSALSWLEWMPNAQITGVDVRPIQDPQNAERLLADPRFRLVLGDARDPATFMRPELQGPWDVVIDDCWHRRATTDPIVSFMFPRLNPGGWLVIEDINFPVGEQRTFDSFMAIMTELHTAPDQNGEDPGLIHFCHRGRWTDLRQVVMRFGIAGFQHK